MFLLGHIMVNSLMKQIFCIFWIFCVIGVPATEKEPCSPLPLRGNLVNALEISSIPVRQATLLKIVADSPRDADLNLMLFGLLKREFKENPPDQTVQERLLQIHGENPADLTITLLCVCCCRIENPRVFLEKSLDVIDPAAWQDGRFPLYLDLVNRALAAITGEGDVLDSAWQVGLYGDRLALLDRIAAKWRIDHPAFWALQLELLHSALYFCDDLVPTQKQFAELPADHPRKKIYLETLTKWKRFLFAEDRKTFLDQFRTAIVLDLPECDHFAAEAVHRYGIMDMEIRNLAMDAAITRKNFALFAPYADGDSLSSLLIALGCKDFEAAAKRAETPVLQRIVALSKAAEERNRKEIVRIFDVLTPQMPLTQLEVQIVLPMIEATRDKDLYWRVRKIKPAFADPAKMPVESANTLGYTAVSLNVDLELANKLLERVYKETKNSAHVDSLAMLRFRQKRYDEAEKLIREAFKLRSAGENASVFLLHAAQITCARGDKATAKKLLDRAKRCVRPEDYEYDASVEKQLSGVLQ